jgi:flagellar motor switch protein FliM
MRMSHEFAPARVLAQHCPELVARGPRPEEREAMVQAWRRDLARHLATDLSALLSGDRLSVEIGVPEWLTGGDILAQIGPVAANSLLRCGTAGVTVLLSFDHANALALADRSFGGEGMPGENSADPLPRSAVLLMDEAATLIANALAKAALGDAAEQSEAPLAGEVIIRSENAARLRPFDPACDCALFPVMLSNQEGCVWTGVLALAAEQLDHLLPGPQNAPRAAAGGKVALAASMTGIPLSLHAVLAQFDLTLSELQALAPGDTIPLAMPRAVPLKIGDAVLAHGSIGTSDERMALRLTHISAEGLSQ